LGVEEKILFGRGHLYDDLADLRFTINYRSFWQINLGTMESILDVLRSFVKPSFKVLDAYCGIGAIGLSLANEISELIGIEEVPEAIEDAKKNAEQNGISNASFFCGRFEDVLPKVLISFPADMVVLDPPRSGVDKESLHSIIKAKIPLIAYLSCSPINLKRDLQIISESGNYTLNSISSFDMFPNTWHIECLAMLSCKL
jgi:23S rRNA (uracil1939-C5)-methyltransferase